MHALLGVFAACVLAGPSAHAFTVENKDEGGQYGMPKFDLEEQAKNFRKGGDAASPGKSDFSTPLGNGTVSFGVTQGPASGFGPGFGIGGLGPTRNSRQDMDRMLAPPTSLEYNGVR
jgi:hypothetical protein